MPADRPAKTPRACTCCGRTAGPMGPFIDKDGLCTDEFCQSGKRSPATPHSDSRHT